MPYILRVPSRYIANNASEEDKKVYDYLKARVEELSSGKADVIVLPADRDENGHRMFEIELI